MSAEIGERSDFSTVDSSRLANTGLVAPATKPSGGKSINAPTRKGPPHPSTIRDSTSSKKPNETDGMSVVRQYYETRGVSKSAVGLLMASWRGGTRKQYSGYIKKWTAFCLQRKINHLQPPVGAVLDFLSELFDKGLTYSAINCARSALSSYVSLDDGSVVGQNPLVCCLLKGVFQSWSPKPKYTEVWDVQVVLTYLATLHPAESLTLKQLMSKLVMLLLLVLGQRGQAIHLLDVNHMFVSDDKYTFVIPNHLKQSKPGVSNPQVVLESSERPCICVGTTLKEYLVRTKASRVNSQSQLLISYVKPDKPVSRDTVTRWVRSTLALAGIDITKYSAHSTRAASVSAASRANVNLDDILQTAGWSSECCFAHFYNKPIAKVLSYVRSVLSSM